MCVQGNVRSQNPSENVINKNLRGSGGNYTLRSFMICISFQYYQGNQVKNDDIGGTNGIDRGEGRCKQGFGFGTLRETGCSEDLGVDGRTILKWILNKSVVRA